MDKLSKSILKEILRNSPHLGDSVPKEDVLQTFANENPQSLRLCVNHLRNEGLLSIETPDNTPLFRLTYKGFHYFKHKKAENRNVLKKSVCIPVIVTLLTHLLLFLLKLLLPQTLQWLSSFLSRIFS